MFLHPGEAEGIKDVRLARLYPQIYETKIITKNGYMKYFFSLIKLFFVKK